MRKKFLAKAGSVIFAAMLAMTPLSAYADSTVVEGSNEEISNPEKINDANAVEDAESDQKNNKLADPEKSAKYLLDNAQTNVVKQTTTDERDTSLPEKFDLRDKGVVTPVKQQNPWGTCWGFAAIAASETSILSEMGKTYEETGLDLSEHHLTYFSRTYLQDGSSQDGEGVHMFDNSTSLDTGGFMFTACSLFSSGIGPVDESVVPYRGLNSKTDSYLLFNDSYSEKDDWTIPSEYEFVHAYNLQESTVLPSPAVYNYKEGDDDGDPDTREKAYVGYDASATDAIKQELMAGRGVSVIFAADSYLPGDSEDEEDTDPVYLNTDDNKWCHYTFDGGTPNHAVTIVGWDDSIKSTDFLDHTDDEYGDGKAHQPEGDGAWIVKNSWGASSESFPNLGAWGIQDEDETYTGYFYLSYYDRSLYSPETFQFDVSGDDANDVIQGYDYLQSDMEQGWADSNGLQMANVFTAEDDGQISEVSCQTNSVNVSVTYQIYLLKDGAVTPSDGTLAATVSDDYAYSGYHKLKLDTPVKVSKGQKYSIVVTSCFTDGDDVYYELSATVADNKEAVEEHNRKAIYRHRGDELEDGQTPEEAYADELISYYSVGIVNEGESFVYMNELGQWADFGQVVPYIQKTEAFSGKDFDNFPIKAYLIYDNADSAGGKNAILSEDDISSNLHFADPAGGICWAWIIKVLVIAGIAIVVFIIFIIVVSLISKRKKQRKKKQLEKIKHLEEENAQLRSLLENQNHTDTTTEEEE